MASGVEHMMVSGDIPRILTSEKEGLPGNQRLAIVPLVLLFLRLTGSVAFGVSPQTVVLLYLL
jgi:hypothetical protein